MSARACTSIQRIDGSTAIRAMSRCTRGRVAMQPDARHQRAGRQQHDAWAVTAELGIELQRPRHQGRRGDAAAAVADHDDLVGRVGFRDLDKTLRAGLDAAVPAGRLAARIFQQIRPMAVDLHHEKLVGQRAQQPEADSAATTPRSRQTRAARRSAASPANAISQPPRPESASHKTSIIWNAVSARPY